MSNRFYQTRVQDVRRETADAVSIVFDLPHEHRALFKYTPGQYLTLRLQVEGEMVNRSYSICSSPHLSEPLRIAVKEVTGGKASTFINRNLKAGDGIEVMPPLGKFTIEVDENATRSIVLFAGGSGITPTISIIKSVLAKEQNSNILLYYANRSAESTIFSEDLSALTARYDSRLRIVYLLEQVSSGITSVRGRLDAETTRTLLSRETFAQDSLFFVCGPAPMMLAVETVLVERGVSVERIYIERFTTKEENKTDAQLDDWTSAELTVKLYGSTRTIHVARGKKILETLIAENLEPPYACQIGACCTCRAKLVSGEVTMDEREGLSDDEVADHYILTCQSHPVTTSLSIDYDQ